MDEMKNCPFCGGESDVNWNWNWKIKRFFVYVKCDTCGAQGKTVSCTDDDLEYTKDLAIRLWNRRTKEGE